MQGQQAQAQIPTMLGVDIGGTFTDIVHYVASQAAADGVGQLRIHKVPSVPSDPSQGLLNGMHDLEVDPGSIVIHGSTVATNALLERKGARAALITTEGFADVLEIGRQDRPALYDSMQQRPPALIPRERRLELPERLDYAGTVLRSPTPGELEALVQQLIACEPESIAISFLYAFRNPVHEQLLADLLRERFPDIYFSLASEILPQFREYERTSTAAVNAYVQPLMANYLNNLQRHISGALRIMQSSGGSISAAVALCPGTITETTDAVIAGCPIGVPTVAIHTVGAGGGSIVHLDEGNVLNVGPDSAGANPGPACYGKGGLLTVTDANLVLGRIEPAYFLGGRYQLYPERAYALMKELAQKMKVTLQEAALGIIRVVNASMERAIRTVSLEKGYDPRLFTLLPFGGAGPLHACELAEALRISRIFIPRYPGVLSAMGMILAPIVKDYVQTIMLDSRSLDSETLQTAFAQLESRAKADAAEQLPGTEVEYTDYLDDDGWGAESLPITVRLRVNSGTLTVDFSGTAPQGKGCINAVAAVTHSAVLYVVRCLVGERVPTNQGCLEPVKMIIPEGSLLNPYARGTAGVDQPAAAVAAGNVETSQRVVDVLFGALARLAPDRVPAASQGTMNNLTFGGYDAVHGKTFAYYETMGGGMGARPGADGLSGVHVHMSNTRNTPIEALEMEMPLQVRRYSLRHGSGGRGRYRGGDGLCRELLFLAPATVTLLTERRKRAPYGLHGGEAGATGINMLAREKEFTRLPAKVTFDVQVGDVLSICTPGGGGFLPQEENHDN
jgi:N-methylhydantoinase A/oxoprolinase/acetone carboxylase beta subunit